MTKRNFDQEFWKAVEDEVKACGLPTEEETQGFFRALSQGRAPKKSDHEGIAIGFYAAFITDLRRAVQKRPIKNEKELNDALKRIQGFRYKLRPALAEMLAKARDMMPTQRRGPQSTLNEIQKAAACSTIETLRHNGMTYKFAIGQTAKEHKITPRLMRKIWQRKGR